MTLGGYIAFYLKMTTTLAELLVCYIFCFLYSGIDHLLITSFPIRKD